MASYPVLSNGMGADVHIHEDFNTSGFQQSGRYTPGTRGELRDGRVFYWCRNGTTTALTRAELLVAAEVQANHVNQTVNAAADFTAGRNVVTLNPGATAIDLNEYAEGYVAITDGTGEGYIYKIKEHEGNAGSTQSEATLYEEVVTTTGASATFSLIKCLYVDPQQSNTDQADAPVGVPTATIAAAATAATNTADTEDPSFGWVQTWGPCSVLNEMTTTGAARGAAVTQSPSTAGSVEGRAAGSAEVDAVVGVMLDTGVDTEFQPVDLRIRP